MKERLCGLLLILISGVLGYLCIYEPLDKAARNDPELSITMKGAIICPAFIGAGLVLAAVGPRSKDIFGERQKPTPFAWIFGILMVGIGFAVYFWLKTTIEGYGYKFR